MSEATGVDLLALSPDEVFASRGVAEVVELQKRIQNEIERKREELRAMVGERYRDLIHAADTIAEMRSSTERAVEHIGGAVALCRNLHDTHLIGFRIPERVSYPDRSNPTAGALSVAVQVKLLLDIPEQIWTCIESEEYLEATQLYMLARHINTGLQLQASSKSTQAAGARVQVLVERQWSSIANLQQILEQAARDKLQEVDLTEEMACSCLLSLYLLDARSDLVALLGEFISLHSDRSLERTLRPRPHAGKDEIRASIVGSVRVVLRTIELVQKCFVEKDGGSLVLRLQELFRKDSPPLLDLVLFQDEAALKLLPPVITSYRLTANKPIEPLTAQEVSESVSKWVSWLQDFLRERITLLLQHITSARTLEHIREEALQIETPSNWREICASLSLRHAGVWARHYRPLLSARVRELAAARWRGARDAAVARLATDARGAGEADLNWFVWRDLIGDTAIESRERIVDTMNALMKGMWLQDRGFTPTLERTCVALETELGRLLAELRRYAGAGGGGAGGAGAGGGGAGAAGDEPSDRAELLAYLRDVSRDNVKSIIQFIREDCFNNPELQGTELQRKTTAVYTARFAQALPDLVPSLRACFVEPSDYLDYDEEGEGGKCWREICAELKDCCHYCWGKWVDIAIEKVGDLTAGLPQEFTVEANLDYLLMQWDVIKIEEKDEEGNPVESTIKIPAGPSLKLQEYLYAIGRILDEIVPHTLPREVHVQFIDKIVDVTLAHYGTAVREKETDINQKCALQLLMDVRHLTLLMVPRENKAASDASHEICEALRKIIDPFDYDVFYPYIQTNVKRSVHRVMTMLGSMSVAGERAGGAAAGWGAGGGGTAERAPALLATPPDAPWFSLLPVTAPHPASALKKPDKMKKKTGVSASPARAARPDLADLVSGSLPINLASAKSGAAAFFGSMTSDWFSGS